jgi:hypothetical protein
MEMFHEEEKVDEKQCNCEAVNYIKTLDIMNQIFMYQ